MSERGRGLIDVLRSPWARTTLEAAGIILVFWLIGRLSEVLTPLLIGLVLAYTLDPVISWLNRRGVNRRLSVTLVFASGALVMALVLVYGLPKAWREGRLLYQQTMIGDAWIDTVGDGKWHPGEPLTRDLNGDGIGEEAYVKRIGRWLSEQGLIRQHAPTPEAVDARAAGADAAPEVAIDFDPVSWSKERIRTTWGAFWAGDHHVLDKGLHVLGRIGFYATALILIPVYGYFFSLNLPRVSRTIIEHVPVKHRQRTLRIFSEINQAVGAFFRGRVLICVILACVASTGFAVARVPSWLVLGMMMGVASAIPLAPLLLLLPACALLYLSTAEAWQYWVACITYVVVQGLEHILILIIMGAGVEIHPVLIIVAILSFGSLFGAPGVLLAVPLAATARILVREFLYPVLRRMAGLEPLPGSSP